MTEKYLFGKLKDGKKVNAYKVDNENGLRVTFLEYGATIQSIELRNSKGEYVDVVLGYEDLEGYEKDDYFLGCIVGRNANRIRGARFCINETDYYLQKNENENNLHSGDMFYKNRIWEGSCQGDKVCFRLYSSDGDQGYPGNMEINVIYELTPENILRMTIEANSDKDTLCNMVNHSYFNLNGHDSGDILGHSLRMPANCYLPNDSEQIPTGEIKNVEGTPFDFRLAKEIGADLGTINGYDNTFCVPGEGLRHFAEVIGEKTGIRLNINSDMPGVQLYTGTMLGIPEKKSGKNGYVYEAFSGLALETQYYPNSINEPEFISPILKANEKFSTVTEYCFKAP